MNARWLEFSDATNAVIPKRSRKSNTWLRKLPHTSFYSRSPIYNTLPDHPRNVVIPETPVEEYKKELDKHLWRIPDQPTEEKLTQGRVAASSSLLDQTRYIRPDTAPTRQNRSMRNFKRWCKF